MSRWLVLLVAAALGTNKTDGYHRAPCKKIGVRRQFQFTDCYAPNINKDLKLNEASFVLAHDAATGYLNTIASDSDGSSRGSSSAYNDEYDNVDNMAGYRDSSSGNRWSTITTRLLSLYGKTQVGSVYDQLNDGARALDLRPKIWNNGTVGFHHGSLIDVPLKSITLGGLLEDAKKWCKDNPKELVIIFHSELVHEAGYNGLSTQIYESTDDDYSNSYQNRRRRLEDENVQDNEKKEEEEGERDEAKQNVDDYYNDDYMDDAAEGDDAQVSYSYTYSGIAKIRSVYEEHEVPYFSCDKIAGLTVAEAMELADLSQYDGKGYLLAVDRHDMYASFCGKANWVQDSLVTCHSQIYNAGAQGQLQYSHCTDRKENSGQSKLAALQEYVKASANNEPTDDYNTLGPPEDEDYYPFTQIQGFWQVDARSVQIGLMTASNLLDDNRRSGVNEELVNMVYNEQFKSISLIAMDNVAVNGNAMFSVLRNACGQSSNFNDDEVLPCGSNLVRPNMQTNHKLPVFWNIVLFIVYGALIVMVSVMLLQAFRLRNQGPQDHRLICNGHVV